MFIGVMSTTSTRITVGKTVAYYNKHNQPTWLCRSVRVCYEAKPHIEWNELLYADRTTTTTVEHMFNCKSNAAEELALARILDANT